MGARSDLGDCKHITSITCTVFSTTSRWSRIPEINWTVSLSQYATTNFLLELKKPDIVPQGKLLIWMKKRGIVRTVKNALQGRRQVVSRREITSVVQMTFKDLDS